MRFASYLLGATLLMLVSLGMMNLAWENPTLPAKELPFIAALAMLVVTGLFPFFACLVVLWVMVSDKDVVIDRSIEPTLNRHPTLQTAPAVSLLGYRPPVIPAIAVE